MVPLRCPQGHCWQMVDSEVPAHLNCPVCGAGVESEGVLADAARTVGDVEAPDLAGVVSVPGYVIERELGRGGMGVVYQARQVNANRTVALKMILAGEYAEDSERQRFRVEALAIAVLQHPSIVQIFEVGEHEGRPFFSMEYCSGGSLEDYMKGAPLPAQEAARLVQNVAQAVQAAHQAQVIHRDLKPANIMLAGSIGEPAESPVEGQPLLARYLPKITDFGLAKKLDASMGHTRTGAILGTPSYMAPEQASGKTREVGPAADVYSLGAILYECLTGRPPFRAETMFDTILQVLERDPVPPSLLNPRVPRDLEAICLKCLQKQSTRRYDSAQALASDLGRYLQGDSVSARSQNLLDWVAGTLQRSQYDVQFHTWGTMLLWFSGIVLVCYLLVGVLVWCGTRPLEMYLTLLHAGMLGAMGVVFWRHRKQGILPTSTAERQMWALVVGFVCSCVFLGVVNRLLATPERPHSGIRLYPQFTVLSGMLFFVLGSSYWGGCVLLGLAFWILALLMPLHLDWAPLEFGVLWSVSLLVVGLHLHTLGGQMERPATPSPEVIPSVSSGDGD